VYPPLALPLVDDRDASARHEPHPAIRHRWSVDGGDRPVLRPPDQGRRL
jgi:hypothetical protein